MRCAQQQILDEVVCEYSNLKDSFDLRKSWVEFSENELWGELCICILSSNVPYDLALSAFYHLREKRFLDPEGIILNSNAARLIGYELSKSIYQPKRKDGSLRKYRFPNVRASDIEKAALTLYCENDSGLIELLKNSASERAARDFLAKNISGIGLKEASHFLRNIGYSKSLAIVDTHIIAFLTEVGELSDRINAVTPRVYLKLEAKLMNLCNDLGLNMSLFDMAIWKYMREKNQ